MNEVKIFNNEKFGQVRTVVINVEPWFVGKDVAVALGYSKTNDAIKTNVNNEDTITVGVLDANNHTQQMIAINESGLYDLVFESRLPSAKEFRHWVTSEVLPSIRQNGGYILNQENLTREQIVANALIVAQNIIADKDKRIKELSPKAEYFDSLVDSKLLTNFRDTAKELGYSQTEFTGWLLVKGYVYKDSKGIIKPYEPYRKQGLFEMKGFKNPYNGFSGTRTYVTIKGKNTFRLLMQVPDRKESQ